MIQDHNRTDRLRGEAMERLDDVRMYSLTELEKILGVSHRTLQTWVKTEKLPAVKIGGHWRVTEATVRSLVNTGI